MPNLACALFLKIKFYWITSICLLNVCGCFHAVSSEFSSCNTGRPVKPKVFTEKPQEATREIQGTVDPLEKFSISASLSRSDSYTTSLKNSRRQSEFGPKWTFLEVELCEVNAFCVCLLHMPFHCHSYNKKQQKKESGMKPWSSWLQPATRTKRY